MTEAASQGRHYPKREAPSARSCEKTARRARGAQRPSCKIVCTTATVPQAVPKT
jgi:hypothetical protein